MTRICSLNRVVAGDCRELLPMVEPNSIHAIVTDSPYEIGFMGRGWDKSGIAYDVGVWRACLRVLRPGGHLVAFGGTRTHHRIWCAIEDAGFEMRDTLMWLYGQGFPKSHDVSKAIDKAAGAEREVMGMGAAKCEYLRRGEPCQGHADANGRYGETIHAPQTAPATADAAAWDGWGTALKPAFEPILLARKPLDQRTVAANVLAHGTGALNIDACRVAPDASSLRTRHNAPTEPYGQRWRLHRQPTDTGGCQQGRWPANLVLAHHPDCRRVGTRRVKSTEHGKSDQTRSDNPATKGYGHKWAQHVTRPRRHADADGLETVEAWECHPDCPVRLLDQQSGERGGGDGKAIHAGDFGKNGTYGIASGQTTQSYADTGGASRFFYQAKAARRERWGWCLVCGRAVAPDDRDAHAPHARHCETCGVDYAPSDADEHKGHQTRSNLVYHPTQKPVELMRWLVRLVCVGGGLVVDPFAGSGSTGVACLAEGVGFVGFDLDPITAATANARLAAGWDLEADVAPASAGPEPGGPVAVQGELWGKDER